MTSVYSDKIYPDITPLAPSQDDEGQTYRLKKIDEAESFLRDEVSSRDKLAKQCKRRAAAFMFSDTAVFTSITILEAASIATLTTGVGTPISVVLASTGHLLGLGSVVVHKTEKMFSSKAKKHDKIKTLAESKLNSISGLVSKAIEDAHVSHQEYHFILKEVKNYRTIKQQIRAKSKRMIDALTSEQREAILAEGRQQGKQNFLRELAASSDIPPVNVM